MIKTKSIGTRIKTLRSGIRATPATLHLEITMLMHHQRRIHSELEAVRERERHLSSLLLEIEGRVEELSKQSESLDPQGRSCPPRATAPCRSTNTATSSVPGKVNEATQNSNGFREMSLGY